MDSQRQAFFPSADQLRFVQSCVEDLVPEDESLAEWHRGYAANHSPRIALDLDVVQQSVPEGSHILEVGSIPLLLTAALARCDYIVTGCDIAPERYASTIAAAGLDVVKCDIEQEPLPFDGDAFDAVVLNEIFEHLRINPIFTLSEVFRVLKPNGVLLLSSPNLKSLGGIRNLIFKDQAYSCSGNIYHQYKKLETLGHMGHVREYTVTEVKQFLESIGFHVEGVIYRGRYKSALGQMVIRMLPRLSPYVSYIASKPATAVAGAILDRRAA